MVNSTIRTIFEILAYTLYYVNGLLIFLLPIILIRRHGAEIHIYPDLHMPRLAPKYDRAVLAWPDPFFFEIPQPLFQIYFIYELLLGVSFMTLLLLPLCVYVCIMDALLFE